MYFQICCLWLSGTNPGAVSWRFEGFVKVYRKVYQKVYQTWCTSNFKKATVSPWFEISWYDSNQYLILDHVGFEFGQINSHSYWRFWRYEDIRKVHFKVYQKMFLSSEFRGGGNISVIRIYSDIFELGSLSLI